MNTVSSRTAEHRRATLEAMARALTREGHVLREFPHLVFQQLFGWLQWEPGPATELIARELDARRAPGAAPWAHMRTRMGAADAFIGAMVGHNGAVEDCAIAPDGSWIVSVAGDETVRLWDPVARRERASLAGHAIDEDSFEYQICAASPDGSWFLSAGPGSVKVWDVATRSELGSIPGAEDPVCSISPDGAWFVTCVSNHHPAIWDIDPLRRRAVLDGHQNRVKACSISPDGSLIASADAGGTILLWDVATASLRSRMEGRTGGYAGPCAFGPDGTWIASHHFVYTDEEESGSVVKVWDVATASELATLTGHTNTILTLGVSPDGTWVVSGSHDETLRIWDAVTGTERATLEGHTDSVTACSVSPDAAFLVSSSWDGTLRVWDVQSALAGGRQEPRASLVGHRLVVKSCPVSPDGASVVSASADRTLRIWDLTSAADRAGPHGHAQSVQTCAASPDGSLFVSGGWEGTLKLWDATDGSERATLGGHTDSIYSCIVSPDANWVASASSDGTLRIFDLPDGGERAVLRGHTEPVVACAPAPDGTWLVSAGWDNTVRIWDARDGAELATLSGHEDWVEFCAVGPDGSWILSQDKGGTVINWDNRGRGRTVFSGSHLTDVRAVSPDGSWMVIAGGETLGDEILAVLDPCTGAERARLSEPTGECAASPDGQRVVSARVDGTLKIWDLVGGTDPLTLRGHTGAIHACPVSSDGRWIASISADEVSRVWSVATGEEVATIPLPWAPFCVCWHPRRSSLFLAGEHGMVALVDLIGIDHGPPVSLAIDVREGPPEVPRRRGGRRRGSHR